MQTEKAILVRYGEVWLKSDPVRHNFERILVDNLRSVFHRDTKISAIPGRIWAYSDSAPKELERIFGVVSFSPVVICDKNMDAIRAAAKAVISKWKSGTFAIRARRVDKSFPLTSKQIEIAVADIVELSVDLSNPDHELSIEIRDRAYLYDKTIDGPGGLPLGSAGKITAQLRDNDDLLSVWLLMKRGALPIIIKPKPALLKILQKWASGRKLKTAKTVNESKKLRAIAIVDSRSKKAKESELPVLKPLVGFSDEEKAELLKKVKG